MMLKIYVAPNGRTYQYEEGKQPKGYKLAPKQSTAKNKQNSPETK